MFLLLFIHQLMVVSSDWFLFLLGELALSLTFYFWAFLVYFLEIDFCLGLVLKVLIPGTDMFGSVCCVLICSFYCMVI